MPTFRMIKSAATEASSKWHDVKLSKAVAMLHDEEVVYSYRAFLQSREPIIISSCTHNFMRHLHYVCV